MPNATLNRNIGWNFEKEKHDFKATIRSHLKVYTDAVYERLRFKSFMCYCEFCPKEYSIKNANVRYVCQLKLSEKN